MYSSLRFFLSLTNDSFFFIQNRPKCYSVFITQQQLNENIAVTFQPFCGNKKHRRWEEKNKSIIKKILSVGSPVFGQGTRNLRLCRFIFSCVPAWGLKSSCQSILLMMFKEYISATAEFLIIRQVSMAENAGIFPRENELPVCSSVLTLSSPPRTRESYRVPQAVTELLTGLGPAVARPRSRTGEAPGPRVQLELELSPEQNWDSANTFTPGFQIPSVEGSPLVWHTGFAALTDSNSHKFIQLLCKARLHSHALLLYFLTALVCSPQISSLAWFKGRTSSFPCEPAQCFILASTLCCCVRAAPVPSQPLPCSLNEPILISFSVYRHPFPCY